MERVLTEHGMTSANPVVMPARARNDDDDDDECGQHRGAWNSETNCGQESVLGSTEARYCVCHEPTAEIPGKTLRGRPHRLETSLAISLWNAGSWSEIASTGQSVHDADSVL